MARDPCKACAPLIAALETENAKLRATNARLLEEVETVSMGNAEKARRFQELRDQGLSGAEIGRRYQLAKSTVNNLLRAGRKAVPGALERHPMVPILRHLAKDHETQKRLLKQPRKRQRKARNSF